MIKFNTTITSTLLLLLAAAATVSISSNEAWAQGSTAHTSVTSGETHRIMLTESNGDESHVVQIHVDGDDIKVVRDGREVPEAQIVNENGSLIITDADGKRLHTVRLKAAGKPGAHAVIVQSPHEGQWTTNIQDLMTYAGAAPKVMLGVQMARPHPALEYHLNLDAEKCTMLAGVYEGLAAHEAGLQPYDIIIEVEGQDSADQESIRKRLAELEPDETLHLTVIQKGRERDISVKLPAYDAKALAGAKLLGGSDPFGFSFWTSESPQWQEVITKMPNVFVTPEFNKEYFELNKEYYKALEKTQPRFFGQGLGEQGSGDLNEKLERLDQRMAELEKLLEKLSEQRSSSDDRRR